MYGKRHPSYEDLALYAEGLESHDDWAELEDHLEHCSECFAAIALHRALMEAEDLAAEEKPEPETEAGLTPRLDPQTASNATLPLDGIPNTVNENESAGFKDWILGLAGGLGLGGFGHVAPVPALGKMADSHLEHELEPHDSHDLLQGIPDISPAAEHGMHDWTHEASTLDGAHETSEINTDDLEDGGEHGHHG
jgi:hypothetical protein